MEASIERGVFMIRSTINSSNLVSVGYEEVDLTMEVEFTSGGIYRYFNVPKHIAMGLMNASSHGSFFYHHIKSAGFRYQRVV